MQIKNKDLLKVDRVMADLSTVKIEGVLKYKLLKIVKVLTDVMAPVVTAYNETTDATKREAILEEYQTVDLPFFTYKELEPLALSVSDLMMLSALLQEDKEDEDVQHNG